MTRATVRQEVRPLRFEALYERRQRRTLTMAEAAELLEITERTVRRWSGAMPPRGRRACRIGDADELRPARCPWRRRSAG